jgi:antitoxin component YwqK of YwqJK toxin-antitoxin module
MILSYKNGKEDGQCVEYWPDHSIRATYKYKNGLLDGTYFEYHPFSNNVYAVSEYGVRNINPESINLSGPYLICTQEYVRGVKHGLEICLYKNAAEILSSIANLLMPSLLKKHLLNKENNKNVRS